MNEEESILYKTKLYIRKNVALTASCGTSFMFGSPVVPSHAGARNTIGLGVQTLFTPFYSTVRHVARQLWLRWFRWKMKDIQFTCKFQEKDPALRFKDFSWSLLHYYKMVPCATVHIRLESRKNAYAFRVPIDPWSQHAGSFSWNFNVSGLCVLHFPVKLAQL